MQIIEDGYGGMDDPIDPIEDLVKQAYYLLSNASTADIQTYYETVEEVLEILAEVMDLYDMEIV